MNIETSDDAARWHTDCYPMHDRRHHLLGAKGPSGMGGLHEAESERHHARGRGGFDFPDGEFAPGLVVLVTPDGNVRQVADDLAFPNGMAITPGGGRLIVAESYADRLTAYNNGVDGSLGNRRVWAQTPGDHPDGICMDAEGAVWYADVGNQHCVRAREGGGVMTTVDLDRGRLRLRTQPRGG